MNKTMDKSKEFYLKALNKYNKGELDKALELCENSIGLNVKNPLAMNLKGLIYYIRGDLSNCKKFWELSYKINKDEISYKYLKDLKLDEELFQKYAKAMMLIKEFKIKASIDILKQCEESDFNCINICNKLSLSYMKLGEDKKALRYNKKVIEIDKCNDEAKYIRKQLNKKGFLKKGINKKVVFILCTIVLIGTSVRFYSKKNIKSVFNTTNLNNNHKKTINKPKSNKKIVVKQQKKENKLLDGNSSFDLLKIKNEINNKEFDKLYDEIVYFKNKELNINNKSMIVKAEELLKSEGIQYFYDKGLENSKVKNYKDSILYLLKAYNLGNVNYLYEHIIYLIATDYENCDNISESLKYYEAYNKEIKNGNYNDLALYKIANLYKSIDKQKSKNYAKLLMKNYPNSLYINSNIENIIKCN